MRQVFMILAVLWCGVFNVSGVWADMPGLETASGPAELLKLEREGAVTVRALRAFGLLPEKYMQLAQSLRQKAGLDLLAADQAQVLAWSQDGSLSAHTAELTELAGFMGQGQYLTWTPIPKGQHISAGTLVRQGGKRWIEAMADAPFAPKEHASQAEPEKTEVPPASVPVKEAPPMVADAGSDGGLEFPVNDQLLGTYKVKLRVEGLAPALPTDHYFAACLPRVLPENPAILKEEAKFFEGKSTHVERTFAYNLTYNRVLGIATPGTPVVIHIDAPDAPEVVSEKETPFSYRVVGKSVYAYVFDKTGYGDSGFKEENGQISWTPHLDPDSGRLTGPRAIGIYMAYRTDQFLEERPTGATIKTSYQRIGWVVVAMPGDIYEHEGALYAVGQQEPVAGAGTSPNWNWPVPAPETLDIVLPDNAMKSELYASKDMRHLAWLEKDKEKRRVVLNGQPGKWYDGVFNTDIEKDGLYFTTSVKDWKIAVCNGIELPPFKEIIFNAMSEDGRHIVVGGEMRDGGSKVFLDGVLVRETSNLLGRDSCVFAPNGTAAWIEGEGGTSSGLQLAHVVFSDGVEGPTYKRVFNSLRFTGSGADFYYSAEKENNQIVLLHNDQELPAPPMAQAEFRVSAGGTSYACPVSCGDEKVCMCVNGQVGPEYDGLDLAVFDQAGARYAYTGYRNNQDNKFLVVDGKEISHEYGPVRSISGLTFSADGKRWAAGFVWGDKNQEEYAILVDGQELYLGKGSPFNIVFSPDGSRVAWRERAKRDRIFLDGQAGPERDKIYNGDPLLFSPDGRHLVYFYVLDKNKRGITVFGGEERIHGDFFPYTLFTEAGVEYLALDGNRLRREVLPLP